MAARYLLDTSVYSQPLKRHALEPAMARLQALPDNAAMVSVVCEAEILYELEKRNSQRMWDAYRHRLQNHLPILPVDHNVAAIYARHRAKLERIGACRADMDLLIAATAIAHKLTLATLNARHFQGIIGLEVEDWSAPLGGWDL